MQFCKCRVRGDVQFCDQIFITAEFGEVWHSRQIKLAYSVGPAMELGQVRRVRQVKLSKLILIAPQFGEVWRSR